MHLQLCDLRFSDNSPQQLPVNQLYTFRSTQQQHPERQANYLEDGSRYHDERQAGHTGDYKSATSISKVEKDHIPWPKR